MSSAQNLLYAIIQVVHNFGAVAVVAGSLIAMWQHATEIRRKLGLLVLAGWMTQAASGATFGLTTLYYDHQLPDISGIAIYAIAIKMACAAVGIVLLAAYLWRGERWTAWHRNRMWIASSALAVTALTSAAFLRWFS